MAQTVYQKLRAQLDQYSTGFPETASGIEYRILKRLFTEEEAAMYLDLTMMLESPASIAERTGRDPVKTETMLRQMVEKGLIFRVRKNDAARYAAVPFVIGSYEFQLNRMDRELAEMTETYFEEALMPHLVGNVPPLRTIPVQKSVDVAHKVAPYADAKAIVADKEKIAVAECICRKQQGLLEKGCGKPREVCLVFGSHADYYVDKGMARFIEKTEAYAILDQCEKAGLVNQPANMVNPGGMCNCCGDCCGVLRGLNQLPKPAEMVCNNYVAAVNAEECTGCGVCEERCQMAAVAVNDDSIAAVNPDRCIGCGLCVTTCPTEAIRLQVKPEHLQRTPPASGRELMDMTARIRGTSLMPLFMTAPKS
ncbi:MAG: 4Fe-4S binding protein [Thermodesulfobacteriota bacterium]